WSSAARRSSRSCSSWSSAAASLYTPVPKSCSRSVSFSMELARRKRRKSPCGRSRTCLNCSAVGPSSAGTSASTATAPPAESAPPGESVHEEELRLRPVLGQPAAPLLGARLRRRAGHAVQLLTEREVEPDLAARRRVGPGGLELPAHDVARPRHHAEEREGHR